MLTTPLFRPWRPIWDKEFGQLTLRLDELCWSRQKGRKVPPTVDGLVNWSDVALVLQALSFAEGRLSSFKFLEEKVGPLLNACLWPRWLLLEDALDHAAASGDLHLAALVLRTQIEELDVLVIVDQVLSQARKGTWDTDAMADGVSTIAKRVLPRLSTKSDDQLKERASDPDLSATRSQPLESAFKQLSEYVHPNYGSHLLSVRPHGIEAAQIIVEAFVAVYESFLTLSWAQELGSGPVNAPQDSPGTPRDPYLTLATDTIPKLTAAIPSFDQEDWNRAATCFQLRAASEGNWEGEMAFPPDVEAIHALEEHAVPSDTWPEAFRSVAGRNRYAFLVAEEHRLAQAAASVTTGTNLHQEMSNRPLLTAALSFSINVTEHKLDSLARHAAHMINTENVLGAALTIRSMLEHHAIAIELSGKIVDLWERAENSAPDPSKVAKALKEAERQIARVLAGSSQPSGVPSPWRSLWQEAVRSPYNVMGPIDKMEAKHPGFLKTYGLLSHILHGTVGTGGDLLGNGGEDWKSGHKPLAAQLTQFLTNLCDPEALMERQAGTMSVGLRLHILREESELAQGLQRMRLVDGQKLKAGRDIFGSGTQEDPYRFRDGLFYYDAYHRFLKQEAVTVRTREFHMFNKLPGDRVETKDGRELYFLDDKLPEIFKDILEDK